MGNNITLQSTYQEYLKGNSFITSNLEIKQALFGLKHSLLEVDPRASIINTDVRVPIFYFTIKTHKDTFTTNTTRFSEIFSYNHGPQTLAKIARPVVNHKTSMSLLLSLYLSPLRRLTHPRCWTPAAAAETSCLQYRMSLLLQLARAYTLMSRYDCPGAVAAFRSLPKDQYRTPWVLCQMAKAHFVQTNYQVSCWLFEKPRRLDPDHVTDMDVYSTALWHLHKVTELSALSEELADSWYLSPQAWCAKGNCLSMHKEHEDAIKFFRRYTGGTAVCVRLHTAGTRVHVL